MPEHARRSAAGLYDQQSEDGNRRVADWGGDDLFTRMPQPPAVDDAPAPRFRPSLVVVDQPEDRRRTPAGAEWSGARDRRRAHTAEAAMLERADRLGLALVDDEPPATERRFAPSDHGVGTDGRIGPIDHAAGPEPRFARGSASEAGPTVAEEWHPTERRWDEADRAPNGRRNKVITGRPDGPERALATRPATRRRPARTPAEWVGPRPERIVGWAFALGLLLILIAISTADAAPL
jgi:hypothetical protein